MKTAKNVVLAYAIVILSFTVLSAIRQTVYATDMSLFDRFKIFLCASSLAWPIAGAASYATLQLIGKRAATHALVALTAGGLISMSASYYFVGVICSIFQEKYQDFGSVLRPDSFILAAPFLEYVLDPKQIFFVLLWVGINLIYWKMAPGAYILGELGHARTEMPLGTLAENIGDHVPTVVLESAEPQSEDSREFPAPGFMKHVSQRLGKDLIAIAAEQHYIRVYTKLGSELILYRFSDAVGELAGWPGLRVHRSHWIMRSAINSIKPRGKSYSVELENGQVVPVSVTHRALVDRLAERLELVTA